MPLVKRLTPFFVGLTTMIGLEIILAVPSLYWFILTVVLLGTAILLLALVNASPRNQDQADRRNIVFIFLPLMITLGAIFFVALVQDQKLGHAITILASFANYFYLKNLYDFLYNVSHYQVNTLTVVSEYLGLMGAFLFFWSFFGLKIFLNYSVVPLALAVFLVTLILIFPSFWLNKMRAGQALLYSLIGAVLITQSFVAITFMPTGYLVNAVVLLATYYCYVNVAVASFKPDFRPRNMIKVVVISALSLILSFATASWS